MEFSDRLYQFTFVWTIENVALSPEKPGYGILSPVFVIQALGGTKWRLYLLPRGKNDPLYVSLFLCRLQEDGKIKQIMVNYRFSIETSVPYLRSLRLATDILFQEDDCWGYPRYLKRDHLYKMLAGSTSYSLTLRCDVGASDAAITHKWNENVDFQMLSNNLLTLYKGEHFADVTLCCDGIDIKVHRCVLALRLPKLLSQLKLLNSEQLLTYYNIFHISLHVLKSLLYYAYSGKLDIMPSETTPELLQVAIEYDLPDLIQRLKSFPRYSSARTTYSIEHKSFAWKIHKNALKKTNPTQLIRIIPTDTLYVDNIIVSSSIQLDLENESVKHIHATFHFTKLSEKRPVFLSCRIYVTSLFGKLFGFCAADHLFLVGSKWTILVATNGAVLEDIMEIRCEMELCDGENSSAVRDSRMPSRGSTIHYNDYSVLSSTMSELFSKKHYSDFTVITKGQTFAVHSAILAARSPVFSKMLQHDMLEKNSREVTVTDTSPYIMQLMLRYMYSGTVRDLEYDEAIGLYEAADKYCILVLKERCAYFLVSKLNSQNAHQLFTLAETRYDNIMKNLLLESNKENVNIHDISL